MQKIVHFAAWSIAFVALPAFGCAITAPNNLVDAGALTFGTMLSTPPQLFMEDTKPAGFDIDLANAIAAQMCIKAKFVNLAFPGLFPGLNAHKFDAVIAGIGITSQRKEVFGFVPYLVGGNRFIVRKASNLHFKDETELCGHSVATVTGSVQAAALARTNQQVCPADKKIDIKTYPSFNEAVEQLRKSVVDVAWVDWIFAAYVVNLMPNLALGSPILSGQSGGPRNREGIVLRKDDAAAQTAVSKAFAAVEASGEYDKILDKWRLQEGDIRTKAP